MLKENEKLYILDEATTYNYIRTGDVIIGPNNIDMKTLWEEYSQRARNNEFGKFCYYPSYDDFLRWLKEEYNFRDVDTKDVEHFVVEQE